MPRGVSNTLDYKHVALLHYIGTGALYQKTKQPLGERKNQNNGSTKPNAKMNSQEKKATATDTEKAFSELLLRLKQRHRLREILYKCGLRANTDNQNGQ